MSDIEDNAKDDHKFLQAEVNKLSARFDSVQIIATRQDGDNTVAIYAGFGNWFAREGSVREWVLKQEHSTRLQTEADFRSNNEED